MRDFVPVLVLNTSWFHQQDHMSWLQNVHGVPADMTCAVLTGNENTPTRIDAWRGEMARDYMTKNRRNPSRLRSPDFVKDFTE